MASDLENLARLARALNPASCLPPLILLTDDVRLGDPVGAARGLPRGCAVILRHRDRAARTSLAWQLRKSSHEQGVLLLISEDAELAREAGADGLHLPERLARTAGHWKTLRPDWLITAAAHSAAAAAAAARARADAVLLAPVFPTRSHPERPAFGALRTCNIARLIPVPVYALGGVNRRTALRLAGSSLAGFAGIDAFASHHNR